MIRDKGLIIANGYLRNRHFEEITHLYFEAAKKQNMGIALSYTHELIYGTEGDKSFVKTIGGQAIKPSFVLFLDKDIRLAKAFENQGVRVFNSSRAIQVCDDKSATFQALEKIGVAMPKTIISPLIYENTYKAEQDQMIDCIEEELGYPLVIKESFGSFGEQVYLAHCKEELVEIRQKLIYKPHLYQRFIKSSYGRDVRLNVVGDQVVASIMRYSNEDFRANVTTGGQAKNWVANPTFREMALSVSSALKLDFAGIDILFGDQGEPVLCEVNSNAHILGTLKCTGINVAEHILAYIKACIEKEKD